jgi:hypothetical protein
MPQSESKVETTIGETVADLYTLEDNFELVPGVWIVELWDGERKLLVQSFVLEKPEAPAKPEVTVAPKTTSPAPKTAPKPATPVKPETASDNF